ncbi:MAG: CocE/NonD family hydrolase [Planctomycetota bacterium]|jgi:putative CocE/NonD family hydrolase
MAERFMVPVRDGVRLETFAYLPPGAGPFPALLARCQYGTGRMEETALKFVEAGYAVALQNVRGRKGSEGRLLGTGFSGADGYDTIDWLAGQHWCDGKVGTFGASALAKVQTAAAFLAHPAHRAMCPQVLPFGMMSRLGGAFMFSQIPQWILYTQSGPDLRSYDEVDWMPHLSRLPLTAVLDELGGPADMLEKYRDAVTDPTRYFRLAAPEEFAGLDTPNLMVTGWYDHCATGPVDFFRMTREHASEQQVRNTHLVIGPWDHSCTPEVVDEYDFGPEAGRDNIAHERRFFDRHLRGDRSAPAPAPVRIFVMGRNRWREETDWPPARAAATELFLTREGGLSFEAPGEEPPDEFTYDPADPVPTVGGANSAPARVLPMRRGPRDQRPVLDRPDVLVYRTDPLPRPLEVTGELRMVLFAASSARDTDFTAKLMDVAPDGNARIISDGVVRARYRNGRDRPELLTPGEVCRFEIDLWFTANEFGAGHRIALAVSSSNFPRIGRNLNTGGDNERDAEFATARQTVFHDAARPSHLVLPVVGDP